jgi:CBS domain-containing protein
VRQLKQDTGFMGSRSGASVLSTVRVWEAMRRQVVRADPAEDTDRCIARMLKYKVGALLVEDGLGNPRGVVSKTDVVAMFYAGLPLDTPIGDMCGGEPVCCDPEDRLESALESMLERRLRRIYARRGPGEPISGVVGHADIVGLLYRYCNRCRSNRFRSGRERSPDSWLAVADVMHVGVTGCSVLDPLHRAVEILLETGVGALAVFGADGASPEGVVSMTDLVRAYRHREDAGSRVARVMSSPVLTCERSEYLAAALRTMICGDVQRIFVCEGSPDRLTGVLSLTDAARIRSGSCKACHAARLEA